MPRHRFSFLLPIFLTVHLSLAHNPPAKCTAFPPTTTAPPSPSHTSLSDLLGGLDSLDDFFATTFERTHLHIRETKREDRTAWQQLYRRFIPLNDVDALLLRNLSVSLPHSPLRLHHDLELVRPAQDEHRMWTRQHIDTLFPHAKGDSRFAIDLPGVHRAFRDGFELILKHVHHRSEKLANLVDGLAHFWLVDVTASLHLAPPRPSKKPAYHVPQVFAEDVFLVQLDGEQQVHVFEHLFPYPAPRHIDHPDVQAAVRDALKSHGTPVTIVLEPGDMLYVPRGTAIDTVPMNPLSLHVSINIATHTSTVDRGIRAVFDAVRDPFPDNPLYAQVETNPSKPGYDAVWIDLLHAAVNVAAEFTPQLRRFLPLGPAVSEAIEDAGSSSVTDLVDEQVRRFTAAASDALFGPLIEVLTENDESEESLRLVASTSVILWARNLVKESENTEEGSNAMRRAERMFKLCVQTVAESSQAPFDGLASLQLEVLERERVERPKRLERAHSILRQHEFNGSKETNVREAKRERKCVDGVDSFPNCAA